MRHRRPLLSVIRAFDKPRVRTQESTRALALGNVYMSVRLRRKRREREGRDLPRNQSLWVLREKSLGMLRGLADTGCGSYVVDSGSERAAVEVI